MLGKTVTMYLLKRSGDVAKISRMHKCGKMPLFKLYDKLQIKCVFC